MLCVPESVGRLRGDGGPLLILLLLSRGERAVILLSLALQMSLEELLKPLAQCFFHEPW